MNYRKFFLFISGLFFAISISAQRLDNLIHLGTNKCNEKKTDSARIYFAAAYKLDSTSKALMTAEANCFLSAGEFDKALKYADRLVALDTTDAESFYARGIIKNRISKMDSSCMNDFLTAMRLKPGYFNAVYNAGAFYYNCNLELKRQVKVCPNPNILTEERKYYMGKAVPYFEEALKLKPDYPVVSNALLSIYKDLGLTEKEKELKKKLGKE